jgi:putative transposase
LKHLLKAAGMARSTFYYRLSERPDKYASVKDQIRRIYEKHKGRYGCRRVWQTLRVAGLVINRKTVARLMRKMSLAGITAKRKYHSYKGEVGRIAPNVIDRNFTAERPCLKLTTDISQFVINGVKLYLSPILDMWNGEIVCYTISHSPNMELVMKMLRRAFRRMVKTENVILHSDQGWQYQHAQYQLALKQHGITQSMSRKGNCLDNSMMENFFGLLKNEFYYANHFADEQTFLKGLADYINYYNHDRIKLRLSMSPVQYRQEYTNNMSMNTQIVNNIY